MVRESAFTSDCSVSPYDHLTQSNACCRTHTATRAHTCTRTQAARACIVPRQSAQLKKTRNSPVPGGTVLVRTHARPRSVPIQVPIQLCTSTPPCAAAPRALDPGRVSRRRPDTPAQIFCGALHCRGTVRRHCNAAQVSLLMLHEWHRKTYVS